MSRESARVGGPFSEPSGRSLTLALPRALNSDSGGLSPSCYVFRMQGSAISVRLVLLTVLLIGSGCHRTVTLSYQVSASARFDPAERPTVWSRALSAFQMRGQLIAMSDPLGGVIRTEKQMGWLPCGNSGTRSKLCSTMEHSQLTIGNDGSAFLRRYMITTAWLPNDVDSPFTDDEWSQVKKGTDDFLSFIVGTTKTAPAPADLSLPAPDRI